MDIANYQNSNESRLLAGGSQIFGPPPIRPERQNEASSYLVKGEDWSVIAEGGGKKRIRRRRSGRRHRGGTKPLLSPRALDSVQKLGSFGPIKG